MTHKTKKDMDELREEFGNRCIYEDDSCNGYLQFAHVHSQYSTVRAARDRLPRKKNGRGLDRRWYDIKRHPEDYVLMCRSHHKRYDSGEDEGGVSQAPPTFIQTFALLYSVW